MLCGHVRPSAGARDGVRLRSTAREEPDRSTVGSPPRRRPRGLATLVSIEKEREGKGPSFILPHDSPLSLIFPTFVREIEMEK